jgi:hypothetical protein
MRRRDQNPLDHRLARMELRHEATKDTKGERRKPPMAGDPIFFPFFVFFVASW